MESRPRPRLRPGKGSPKTGTRHRNLYEDIFSMHSNGPPHHGGQEARHSTKQDLAARELEPIRKHDPCRHIDDPTRHRSPQMREISFEEPDLDCPSKRPKNQACNRPLH